MVRKMNRPLYQIPVIFFASILLGFAYNAFLLPHKILSGGVTGVAMIFGLLTPIDTGVMIFALNVPILIMGFFHLGKRFIAYSVFSVLVTTISMQFIPTDLLQIDTVLASVFGGVISGIAIGLIFKSGGSTGGFDIIGMILTKKKDMALGNLFFIMNAVVIFFSGFLFGWDLALYTMVSIFASGKVIDAIHTQHIKLTLMIITSKGEEIKEQLLSRLYRGITILEGEGAYTKEKRKVLITVISRYELTEVKSIIKEIDPKSFVNITETVEVMGFFHRN
jgi:uncharacterized membrane-anchored protein YitT (DUF2179 family)